ncbi:MAG TPA: hypothetical protein VD978_20970 [Azospirillum sp.]|nr:hypothetical protein [Azospirillum sp.]
MDDREYEDLKRRHDAVMAQAVVVPIGEAAPEITAVPVGGRGRAA